MWVIGQCENLAINDQLMMTNHFFPKTIHYQRNYNDKWKASLAKSQTLHNSVHKESTRKYTIVSAEKYPKIPGLLRQPSKDKLSSENKAKTTKLHFTKNPLFIRGYEKQRGIYKLHTSEDVRRYKVAHPNQNSCALTECQLLLEQDNWRFGNRVRKQEKKKTLGEKRWSKRVCGTPQGFHGWEIKEDNFDFFN